MWLKRLFYRLVPEFMLVRRGPRNGQIYLTFDDGPHSNTERLLEILKAEGARATFFLVGEEVEKYPDTVRRTLREGHAVGGHSWSHLRHPQGDFARLWDEISRTKNILREVCGVEMKDYRPPFGRLTIPLLIFALLGKVRIVLWSVDSDDDRSKSVARIREMCSPIADGDVVLFHDDNAAILQALPSLIRNFRSRGFHFGLIGHSLRAG